MLNLNLTFLFAALLLLPLPAIGQIIPDNSLGAESSRTVPDTINNLPSDRITGGATRGVNLFHSFREFNVGEGRAAYFANPNGIANIFTRVTGGKVSNILGILGVSGNANLFLLNPRGIIFGPNARLDVRGSFLATSADSVVFDNGYQFSSSNPQSLPLLNVNIPIGLNFRENPGKIINNSVAQALTLPQLPPGIPQIFNNIGLAVQPGQTLALVGGDIELNQGIVTASTGQVLLGSVASPGFVGFGITPFGLSLNYDKISNFGNIEIINGSLLNTSGLGGGKVDIRGGNVSLNGGLIYALTLGNIDGRGIDINAQKLRAEGGTQISTVTAGAGTGGAVNIRATDSVELSGIGFESYKQFIAKFLKSGTIDPFDPQIVLISSTAGSGNAGNITIDTPRVLIENGVGLGSATLGSGNGGNLTIRARVFDLAGSGINNGTLQGSTGTGGNITFEGERFIVRDGGVIASITRTNAAAGNINITASESVEVLRSPTGTAVQTFIGTNAIGLNGRAGDVTIDTKRLIASEGAGITLSSGAIIGESLFATTGGSGGNLTIRATESIEVAGVSGVLANVDQIPSFLATQTTTSNRAGDIQIYTPVLILRDGGIITAASLGAGDAGNVTIDAGRVEVIGSGNNGRFISKIEASVGSVLTFSNPNATANAGSVNLNANRLIVRDGATVNVQALGTGRAGNINVVAKSIALDTKGRIDGTTVSGTGANINLQARDIQLRRGSRITTDAGISDGGNININSNILATLPDENSDITANARSAQGGRVNINVPNVFGFSAVTRQQVQGTLGLTDAQFAALQVSPTSLVSTSDIAAISQSGGPALQGTVTFSASGVNPAQGLVALPQNVVDPATLIAANPCIEESGNEFTITGRGGVPPNPNDVLSSNSATFGWVEPAVGKREDTEGRKQVEIPAAEIIPARGWVMNNAGEVTLVAVASTGEVSQRSWRPLSVCVPK